MSLRATVLAFPFSPNSLDASARGRAAAPPEAVRATAICTTLSGSSLDGGAPTERETSFLACKIAGTE
ncbi:unnamed protein product [Pichia kudriavzevii]